MNLGTSIRRGVLWTFAGNAGTQVVNFVVGVALARLLTPADFGILATVGIFTGIAGFVASGGISDALVRAESISKSDYDVAFTLQLIVGVGIFLFFFFTAPAIGNWYNAPEYADVLRISALSFLLRPFIMTPTSMLYREMRFKPLMSINLAMLLFSSAVSIGLALAGFGIWSLLLSGLVGSIGRALLIAFAARWRPGISNDFSRARALIDYGALSSFGDFLSHLNSQASIFVISRMIDAHALGVFNKANQFSQIPHTLVTGPVYQVTFRALASTSDNRDLNQYIYLRAITLVSFYSTPMFVSMVWLADPIISLLYGGKWAASAPLLIYLSAIGPILALENLAGCVLAAFNWLRRELPVQATLIAVVTLGTVAGSPYGLEGMCFGIGCAAVYGCLHLSWLASRCLQLPLSEILKAPLVPLCYGVAVLLMWAWLDRQFNLKNSMSELTYVTSHLGLGAMLYVALFLCWPASALASERSRWTAMVLRRCKPPGSRQDQDEAP